MNRQPGCQLSFRSFSGFVATGLLGIWLANQQKKTPPPPSGLSDEPYNATTSLSPSPAQMSSSPRSSTATGQSSIGDAVPSSSPSLINVSTAPNVSWCPWEYSTGDIASAVSGRVTTIDWFAALTLLLGTLLLLFSIWMVIAWLHKAARYLSGAEESEYLLPLFVRRLRRYYCGLSFASVSLWLAEVLLTPVQLAVFHVVYTYGSQAFRWLRLSLQQQAAEDARTIKMLSGLVAAQSKENGNLRGENAQLHTAKTSAEQQAQDEAAANAVLRTDLNELRLDRVQEIAELRKEHEHEIFCINQVLKYGKQRTASAEQQARHEAAMHAVLLVTLNESSREHVAEMAELRKQHEHDIDHKAHEALLPQVQANALQSLLDAAMRSRTNISITARRAQQDVRSATNQNHQLRKRIVELKNGVNELKREKATWQTRFVDLQEVHGDAQDEMKRLKDAEEARQRTPSPLRIVQPEEVREHQAVLQHLQAQCMIEKFGMHFDEQAKLIKDLQQKQVEVIELSKQQQAKVTKDLEDKQANFAKDQEHKQVEVIELLKQQQAGVIRDSEHKHVKVIELLKQQQAAVIKDLEHKQANFARDQKHKQVEVIELLKQQQTKVVQDLELKQTNLAIDQEHKQAKTTKDLEEALERCRRLEVQLLDFQVDLDERKDEVETLKAEKEKLQYELHSAITRVEAAKPEVAPCSNVAAGDGGTEGSSKDDPASDRDRRRDDAVNENGSKGFVFGLSQPPNLSKPTVRRRGTPSPFMPPRRQRTSQTPAPMSSAFNTTLSNAFNVQAGQQSTALPFGSSASHRTQNPPSDFSNIDPQLLQPQPSKTPGPNAQQAGNASANVQPAAPAQPLVLPSPLPGMFRCGDCKSMISRGIDKCSGCGRYFPPEAFFN